ncbi:DUF262 domain-containing protein [Rhizobium leguminosarum]|uniref:DUF262 domain-containing protein n=1 Tax=Rhizobium leguminosarum TaxID=384 RepID=UPI00102F537D|nr:DUF262 domain-containing protein [Rhizobium leguminosarum]TAV92044.1 DUF262 domain-containing protein [Rhizobium leguminosarum]TAV96652.1 DUF262 domain-containing protein [Rhizobium leguminosarum]TAW37729.1 DUF262 domain-containing protein [Rhizobium leguminosarum]
MTNSNDLFTGIPIDQPESPEGIDDAGGDGWGDYPLDAVFVRTDQRTVGDVVARITKNRYILDPDFQREFVWEPSKQSKLIESCVMRIPLPVFYVAEAPDGRIIVVDGLQRLTTFARFLTGELRLTGLTTAEGAGSHQLENKTFEELPLVLQERVLDTQLTMYILDAKAPERARLDIFERVNSGAVLTRQQMRNALYNGPATRWLKAAAEGAPFRAATAGSLDRKTMRDREAINRFVAFSLQGWRNYTTGDMDSYLAAGLTALERSTEEEREGLRWSFDKAMERSFRLFNQHAFRKSLVAEYPGASRSVINISLFEVSSVIIARDAGEVSDDVVHRTMVGLLKDENFARSITYSTNSTQAVRQRFQMFEAALALHTVV